MRGVDTAAIVDQRPVGHRSQHPPRVRRGQEGRPGPDDRHQPDGLRQHRLRRRWSTNIQELFGKACVLFNVPLGQGADFRGVASTLKPPADTAGALVDPAEISESLLETIIEVDEAVTERYFEGTPPTDEELAELIVKAVAQGHADSDPLRVGQDGRGLAGTARRAGRLCACRPTLIARTAKNAAGEDGRSEGRSGRAAGGPGFKTRIDPFVQKLNFIRVFSGTLKKDTTMPVVGVRKPREDRRAVRSAGRRDRSRSTRPGPAASWPWPRSKTCTPARTLGELTLPPIPFPTPMVGLAVTPEEPRRRRQALRRAAEDLRGRFDLPPRSRSRRPRKWSSPA